MWYYVTMSKSVKQMNKAELIAYAAEVGREDVNDDMTKREILMLLEEEGLDEIQESVPEKPKAEVPADDGDKKIVKMLRNASYYAYGPYVFSSEQRFVLMDSESADRIVEVNPGEFKIASTKEVEEHYSE